jgi:hypothetical protein
MNQQFLILKATENTVTVEIPWGYVKEAIEMHKEREIDDK